MGGKQGGRRMKLLLLPEIQATRKPRFRCATQVARCGAERSARDERNTYSFRKYSCLTARNSDPSFHCGHSVPEASLAPTRNSSFKSSTPPSKFMRVVSNSSDAW